MKTQKKILLALIVGLQLLTLPAFAKNTVLIDRTTQSAAEQLDIQIPADVPPGHHEVQIEVSDDAGIVSAQTIYFCKTDKGIIKWDDLCPGELAPYDPSKDPKGVTGLAVAAFALLSAVGGSIASSSSSSDSGGSSDGSGTPEPDTDQSSLEAIEAGELRRHKRKAGWGDKARTWRFPLTWLTDREFGLAANQFSRFSPLMHRLIIDGTYLRAMVGSLGFLIYPFAIFIGFKALDANNWNALPTTVGLTMVGIAVGLFDAYAGFAAAYVFFIGNLVQGNLDSRHHILTVVGFAMLWFVPGLMASAFRPIRREVKNFADFWERATDYAIATLLMGWGVQKLVLALGGLSGYKVPLMAEANKIAIFAGAILIIRFILEEIATYSYAVRVDSLHVEEEETGPRHHLYVTIFRAVIFNLTAELFIGNSVELWFGTALFLIPSIIEAYATQMPNSQFMGKLLPTGAVKTVAMILIGTYFANALGSEIKDPHQYLRSAFVVLTIPTVIIGAMYALASSERDASTWQKTVARKYAYRLLGIVVYIILFNIVKGVDVMGAVRGWFGA